MNLMRPPLVIFLLVCSLPALASEKKDIESARGALLGIADKFNSVVESKAEFSEVKAVYNDSLQHIDRLQDLPRDDRHQVRHAIEQTFKQVEKLHELVVHFHKAAERNNLRQAVEEMERRWHNAHKEIAKLDRIPQARKNAADDEMINALKIMHQALESREEGAPAQQMPAGEHKREAAKQSAKLVPSAPAHQAAVVAVPVEEKKNKAAEAAAQRAQRSKEKTKLKKHVKGSKELYPGIED